MIKEAHIDLTLHYLVRKTPLFQDRRQHIAAKPAHYTLYWTDGPEKKSNTGTGIAGKH